MKRARKKKVVEEKKELDQKLNMLNAFIEGNAFFDTLPSDEKKRLIKQTALININITNH